MADLTWPKKLAPMVISYPFLIFSILFALYAYTAPRIIALYDDANFVLSSYFLVPVYPPGYPAYVLLAHPARYIPIGTVAYRYHLFSAFFGALTCVSLWFVAKEFSKRPTIAFLAALSFGVSCTFWGEAIIAKNYTLNTFLFFTLLWFALTTHQRPNIEANKHNNFLALGAFSFLLGLALSNHWPLIILYGIIFPYFFWDKRILIIKYFPWLLIFLVIGLLPYLWMWWRGQQDLPINPHGLFPFESLSDIFSYVRRESIKIDNDPLFTIADKVQFVTLVLREWISQYTLLGVPFIMIGFYYAWKHQIRARAIMVNLLISILLPQIMMLMMLNFSYTFVRANVFSAYPVISYGLASILFAFGAVSVLEFIYDKIISNRLPRISSYYFLSISSGLLVMMIALHNVWLNNRNEYRWPESYAKTVFSLIPPNARILCSEEYDITVLGYYHLVEQMRPDLTFYSQDNYFNNLPFANELKHYKYLQSNIAMRKEASLDNLFMEMRTKFFKLIERSAQPFIILNSSELNKLFEHILPLGGLLSQVGKDENGKYVPTLLADAQQVKQLSILLNTHYKITDPWTIMDRSRHIRTFNFLAICLNLEKTYKVNVPMDRVAPLEAALGTVDGLLTCRNDLSAAKKVLESAQPFLNSQIERYTLYEYYRYLGEIESQLIGITPRAIQFFTLAVMVYPLESNLALKHLLKIYAYTGNADQFYKITNTYLKNNRPKWYLDLEIQLRKSRTQ